MIARRKRPFESLRRLMAQMGVTQRELVDAWNESTCSSMGYSYFSELMTGRRQFRLDLAYFILGYLEIPDQQLNEYFPKGGYAA